MKNQKLVNAMVSRVRELGVEELCTLIVEYTSEVGNDNQVFYMDDIDDILVEWKPSDLIDRIFYGDFNPRQDFFNFNGEGNLVSYTYWELVREFLSENWQIEEMIEYYLDEELLECSSLLGDIYQEVVEELEEVEEEF